MHILYACTCIRIRLVKKFCRSSSRRRPGHSDPTHQMPLAMLTAFSLYARHDTWPMTTGLASQSQTQQMPTSLPSSQLVLLSAKRLVSRRASFPRACFLAQARAQKHKSKRKHKRTRTKRANAQAHSISTCTNTRTRTSTRTNPRTRLV